MTQTPHTQPKPPAPVSPAMLVLMLAALAITFYLMIAYVGPFQWLAEWEMRVMGVYSEKLTFLVVYLLVTGALFVAVWPFKELLSARKALAGASGEGGTEGGARSYAILARVMSMSGVFVIVGIIIAVIGFRDYQRATHAGDLKELPIERLEAGEPPPSLWVKARGYALIDGTVEYGKKSSSMNRYVPVVSHPDGVSAEGIHLFVKVGTKDAFNPPTKGVGEFEGVMTRGDLPGPVRAIMEREDVIKGDDYYVLDLNSTPGERADRAKTMGWVGVGMAAAGVIGGIIGWMRSGGVKSGESSASNSPSAAAHL